MSRRFRTIDPVVTDLDVKYRKLLGQYHVGDEGMPKPEFDAQITPEMFAAGRAEIKAWGGELLSEDECQRMLYDEDVDVLLLHVFSAMSGAKSSSNNNAVS